MMSTTKWGYQEAAKIDRRINKLLVNSPIEDSVAMREETLEWLVFTRTIRSSLDLIDNKIKDIRRSGRRRRWDD